MYIKNKKMIELDIVSLLYLAFRLAPFILVCFFTLNSVFNQDLKGIIYLVGLLFACFVAIIVGNSFTYFLKAPSSEDNLYNNITKVCNVLNLSKDGAISNLPLSVVVFSYTLFYLIYPIAQNNTAQQNLPTIILFPLLIIGEVFWNIKNGCFNPQSVVTAALVGCFIGLTWSAIIFSLKNKNLLYFNGISNKETCTKDTHQTFRCVPKKNNV
jgi:hypothetical protein